MALSLDLNNQIPAILTNIGTDYLSNLGEGLFGDSDVGRGVGTALSQGISSVGNTMANNILKGTSLTYGLGQNLGQSLEGAAWGIGGNLVGRGINALGGDSKLSRGIGQGLATGIANAPNIYNGIKSAISTGKAIKDVNQTIKTAKTVADVAKGKNALQGLKALQGANLANLGGAGMGMVGAGLQAAFGPSKEYGGKYGNVTQTMDTIYDVISTGATFFGPIGSLVSGAMALNKGLSNIFGSTSGMTLQDAILGSAFMPAPVKWTNMINAKTTSSFKNQSWQNSEKSKSFMGNAFGNLQEKFDKAKEEAGKTYGLLSQGAYRDAQRNIEFANKAWDKIMSMTNQNEYQNIRSQAMSSINNQRYAQGIQGGWSPLARGKYGMKILNNATNHNIGMRLLSGAALIDNKQMILCSVVD